MPTLLDWWTLVFALQKELKWYGIFEGGNAVVDLSYLEMDHRNINVETNRMDV